MLPVCVRNVTSREASRRPGSGESMASAKETMAEIIARQPEDSSYDEILRELAFARMVQRGLEDSDAGRTMSDEAVKQKMSSWQK